MLGRATRELFLAHVAKHRAPRIAAHWTYLLQPLVSNHSDERGALRYRQIEYYRMPMMAYVGLDKPRLLARSDFNRLGLATGAGEPGVDPAANLPHSEQHQSDFKTRYCYDRLWTDSVAAPNTRYLCSGHALVVIGDARSDFYCCAATAVCSRSSGTSVSCCF